MGKALSDNAKTLALASPGVRALSREEYFAKAAVIQELASAANIDDTDEGHSLCDYAFAGLLWAEGRLQEVPVEVAVQQTAVWIEPDPLIADGFEPSSLGEGNHG